MTNDLDSTARGAAIKRRRLSHGIKSIRDFSERTGVDRAALTKAEAGDGGAGTYDRLEAWLDNFEEEIGVDDTAQNDLVTFKLTGNFGVEVTVQGPVSSIPEMEASIARLLPTLGSRGEG